MQYGGHMKIFFKKAYDLPASSPLKLETKFFFVCLVRFYSSVLGGGFFFFGASFLPVSHYVQECIGGSQGKL